MRNFALVIFLSLAVAAQAQPMLLSVSGGSASCTGAPANALDVTLNVASASDLESFQVQLDFSTEALDFVNATSGAGVSDWETANASETAPGSLQLIGTRLSGTLVNGTAELLVLHFQCVQCPATSDLTLSNPAAGTASALLQNGIAQCTPAEGAAEGIAEGVIEGSKEGLIEGGAEGITEGLVEGQLEGIIEGVSEGMPEGSPGGEGTTEGIVEGIAEGEGVAEGFAEGVVEGIIEGALEGEGLAEGEGITEGIADGEGAGVDPLTDVIYVSKPATDSGANAPAPDGLSWATALQNIQDGIDLADSLGRAEVWVARGSYGIEPDPDGVLRLKEGVAVYGGFRGDEQERGHRDLARYVTTIDGAHADGGDPSLHVVYGAQGAVLDGFTVRGGVGDGGGLLVQGVAMTVRNCTFRDNHASRFGGGLLAVTGADVTLVDCVFRDNIADINGGAISASNAMVHVSRSLFYRNRTNGDGGACYFGVNTSVDIAGARFTENEANDAGAVALAGNTAASLRGCWFGKNHDSGLGGALRVDTSPAVTVANSVFSNNISDVHGGAVNNVDSSPFFVGCTFSGNAAEARGGIIYNQGDSNPRLLNCILANTPGELIGDLDSGHADVSYSLVEGVITPGTGNLQGDPKFVDEASERYGLKAGSPCIDTGRNTSAPENGGESSDFAGNARGFDGDGFGAISGDGSEFDMGAFEAPIDGFASDDREVPRPEHSGDTNHDNIIGLSEVLRIIQFYNAGSFGCQEGTEDGYQVDSANESCPPHSSDYLGGDFIISLSELLRSIQLFNLRGYYLCPGVTQDGFCAV